MESWQRYDLGMGHSYSLTLSSYNEWNPIGLIEWHNDPQGKQCMGGVNFDMPLTRLLHRKALRCAGKDEGEWTSYSARWTVHSLQPLHIEPSILCSCGVHGYIRNGLWVPA